MSDYAREILTAFERGWRYKCLSWDQTKGIATEIARLKIENESLRKEVAHGILEASSALVEGKAKQADEIMSLKAQLAEWVSLFALQHSRVQAAEKRWQDATGRHDAMPDLGTLIEWLMAQADANKAELAEARQTMRDVADERTGLWLESGKLIELPTIKLLRKLCSDFLAKHPEADPPS